MTSAALQTGQHRHTQPDLCAAWLGGGEGRSPHVDRRRVDGGAEQHVRRPVPQRDHLVAVRLGGHRLGARQTEVRQLQLAQLVDEQVLRLEVPVQHPVLVAVGQAAQQLEQEQLSADEGRSDAARWGGGHTEGSDRARW